MTHRLAGKTVALKASDEWPEGTEFHVEDSAIDVLGTNPGNPARLFGFLRIIDKGLDYDPDDPELLYGKIGFLGYMIHPEEIVAGERL